MLLCGAAAVGVAMRRVATLTPPRVDIRHRTRACVCASLSDPHAILGVPRTATAAEVKRAYKLRAQELHPDHSSDPDAAAQFQQLVDAFKKIGGRAACKPGSLESHPMWSHMSELDTYWAHELGYGSAAALEEWLQALNWYEENEMEPPTAGAVAEGGEEAPAEELELDAAASAASPIDAVLEYRVHLGNEQWRVRWADGGEESWEVLSVLDTDALRDSASKLRGATVDDASPYHGVG